MSAAFQMPVAETIQPIVTGKSIAPRFPAVFIAPKTVPDRSPP